MDITRRQFIAGSVVGLGTVSTPALLSQLISPAEAGLERSIPYAEAFSLLGRISYGPTITECQLLFTNGWESYIDAQLKPLDAEDTVCAAKLAKATLHIEYKAGEKKAEEKKSDDKKTEDKKPAESSADAMSATTYPAVNEERALTWLDKPIEELWKLTNKDLAIDGKERQRPVQEVRAMTWIRAVHSRWQLREIMVEFWHNHFNVNAFSQQQILSTFPQYDAIMRRNCLGNFRTMLEEVATSPAMLYYLNNAKSKASPANENYARELFELHTLSANSYYNNLYNRWREVPGATAGHPIGYIDQDVYEAARAFTGWTIEDGSNTGRGTILPNTGKFAYFDGWHDNYQKRVLGTEFDPNTPPMEDGRKVLDLVSAHNSTAIFLCTKLCRRFMGDNPPADLVKNAAKVWQQSAGKADQIAQVLKTILMSPQFASAKEKKIKRPFEFAVSFLRATGADVTPNESLFNAMSSAGYKQFEWAAPTGHPDVSEYWLNTNTALSCWNLIPSLFSSGFKAASFDLAQQTPSSVRTTPEIASYWFQRLTGQTPDRATLSTLVQFMPHSDDAAFVPYLIHPDFNKPLQEMLMGIAMLPQFATRG